MSALKRMRQFYLIITKGATLSHQLSWSHYIELLRFNEPNIITYYINITIKYNQPVRELRNKIKNNEYQRLDEDTKQKLIIKKEKEVKDFIKHPIIINNKCNYNEISANILKQLILEDLDNFFIELGNDFCYLKNEYKIKIGNIYNYIDLLLYSIKFNCYVVIKLKVTKLKA